MAEKQSCEHLKWETVRLHMHRTCPQPEGKRVSNDTVSHMWEREGETVEGILRESG